MGQLALIPCYDWYLPNGLIEIDRLLAAWQSKVHQAAARFGGLRVTGDTSWLESNRAARSIPRVRTGSAARRIPHQPHCLLHLSVDCMDDRRHVSGHAESSVYLVSWNHVLEDSGMLRIGTPIPSAVPLHRLTSVLASQLVRVAHRHP